MGLVEFISALNMLHDKARKGPLSTNEQSDYDGARETLARSMLQMQKIALPPGGKAREYVRAPKMVQVEVQVPGGRMSVATMELWGRGFAALLAEGLPLNKSVNVQVKLRPGVVIECEAIPTEAKRQASNFRVAFDFDGVKQEDVDRILLVVFDEVLAKLAQAKR